MLLLAECVQVFVQRAGGGEGAGEGGGEGKGDGGGEYVHSVPPQELPEQ